MKSPLAALVAAIVAVPVVAAAAPTSARRSLRHHDTHRASHAASTRPDEVHLGVLGGVGFPRLLGVEAMLTIDRAFSLGVEYSVLPTANVGGIDFGLHAFAADVRVFPLESAFFVGMRAGRQHLAASATVTDPTYGTLGGSLAIDTWFVNPRAGFLWTWGSGLSVGVDAGLQIPLSHTEATSLPNGVTVPTGLASTADFFGKKVVPTVTVLQAGMMF